MQKIKPTEMRELENLMQLRCFIMCYYPAPDIFDRIKIDVRRELLEEFLKADIIKPEVYKKIISKY